jgi:hypothetical protein
MKNFLKKLATGGVLTDEFGNKVNNKIANDPNVGGEAIPKVDDDDDKKSKDKEEDKDEKTKGNSNDILSTMFGLLSHSINQSHYWHLVTESEAEHKALNQYYDTIPDLMDTFIESAIVLYDSFDVPEINKLESYDEGVSKQYFKKLFDELSGIRKDLKHEHLKSEMDNILSFVSKTSYLLTLK